MKLNDFHIKKLGIKYYRYGTYLKSKKVAGTRQLALILRQNKIFNEYKKFFAYCK